MEIWRVGVVVVYFFIRGLCDRSCGVLRGLLGGLVHLVFFNISSLFVETYLLPSCILGSERYFLFTVSIGYSLTLRLSPSFAWRISTPPVNQAFPLNVVKTFYTLLNFTYYLETMDDR
jgi:hypothetical protein